MSKIILLDSSPLGLLSHPHSNPTNDACNHWAQTQLQQGVEIVISEIADYEVRRELLRAGKTQGLAKLDSLQSLFGYMPLNTQVMRQAAEFWAQARRLGYPTAADHKLDADVILAAQSALLLSEGDEVMVATANPKHLARFVPAALWLDIT